MKPHAKLKDKLSVELIKLPMKLNDKLTAELKYKLSTELKYKLSTELIKLPAKLNDRILSEVNQLHLLRFLNLQPSFQIYFETTA